MYIYIYIYIVSYALLESAIWPDIQPKSSKSHQAEPSGIWMAEGGYLQTNFQIPHPVHILFVMNSCSLHL